MAQFKKGTTFEYANRRWHWLLEKLDDTNLSSKDRKSIERELKTLQKDMEKTMIIPSLRAGGSVGYTQRWANARRRKK